MTLPVKKIRIQNIKEGGELGKFCGNAESMGWMREDGERMVVQPVDSVKRAEWFEGQLRILCETEPAAGSNEPGSEVIALEGFAAGDYESIWRYFEQSCGVHVKRHRKVAALDAEDFDLAMRGIEDAADRVDEAAAHSPQKKGRELDLLKKVENARDGLEQAVSGDKQALNRVFSENNCERIGRLRLVLDTVTLEVYTKDPRWLHLRNACATIEAVLKDLGTFKQWRPSEDKGEHASMLRRMMVRELKRAQGQAEPEEDEAAIEAARKAAEEEAAKAAARKLDPSKLAVPFHYGAAHPLYGQGPPAPEPEPAPQPEPAGGDAAAQAGTGTLAGPDEEADSDGRDGGGDGGEDLEDEEVTNPNAAKASAPDDMRRGDRMLRTHPGSILEGWVWKRSRFLRRWRRRWLVLMPEHLMSFKSRQVTNPTETIMSGTVLRAYSADAEVLQSRSFGVMLSRRTHFMVCDDEKQKEAWIREISKALVSRR